MIGPWLCFGLAVVAVALAIVAILVGHFIWPLAAIINLASAVVLVWCGINLRRIRRTP